MRIETGTVMTGRLSVIRDHTTAFKNRLEVEVELPDGPVRISGFAAWYRPAPDGVNWNVGLYIRDMPAADRARYQAYRDAMRPLLAAAGGGFRYDFEIGSTLQSEAAHPITRLFAIHFPDRTAKDAFFSDPAYLAVRERYFAEAVRGRTVLAEYER